LVYILPLRVWVCLHAVFFWWAPKNYFISARVTFQPFKIIQGHWFWCQSKARMRLPISPS